MNKLKWYGAGLFAVILSTAQLHADEILFYKPVCKGSPKTVSHLSSSYNENKWHDCFGHLVLKLEGEKFSRSGYLGLFQNGDPHGSGVKYAGTYSVYLNSSTSFREVGEWKNGVFIRGVFCNYLEIKHGRFKNWNKHIKSEMTKYRCDTKFSTKGRPSSMRIGFAKLSFDEKKLVQTNLRALGFYQASIDALYGRKTAAALERFNKEFLLNFDIKKISGVDQLLSKVIAHQQPASLPINSIDEQDLDVNSFKSEDKVEINKGLSAEASFRGNLPKCPLSDAFHNCFGAYNFANGDKYIGEFNNNKLHGQGTLTYANGGRYIGEFDKSKFHGQGTLTYADGDKYIGEFDNNKSHGQGTLIFTTGDKFVGEFKNGKSHGQGVHTFANGDKVVGEWKNGEFQYVQSVAPLVAPPEMVAHNNEIVPIGEKAAINTSLVEPIIPQQQASAGLDLTVVPVVEGDESANLSANELADENSNDHKAVPRQKPLSELYADAEWVEAFQLAQKLSQEGNAQAQMYLGRLYAEGRGTLMISRNAHMWFNIASSNGNNLAHGLRERVEAKMSSITIEEAQKMAILCVQSGYMDCGFVKIGAEVEGMVQSTNFEQKAAPPLQEPNFKTLFLNQPTLKRKQLQFALKNLGFYSSGIDGLWGPKTLLAFRNYSKLEDRPFEDEEDFVTNILTKVDVPNSFPNAKSARKTPAMPSQNNYSSTLNSMESTINEMALELRRQQGIRTIQNSRAVMCRYAPGAC